MKTARFFGRLWLPQNDRQSFTVILNEVKDLVVVVSCIFLFSSMVFAEGAGTSSGMALLRNSGARASALAEAFTSMSDDVTAMDFNPASLATLRSGHVSLQYERGFFDDSFSKAMAGLRVGANGALGVSLGYYNSGDTVFYDGVTERSATAEQGRLAGLGYGFAWKSISLGLGAKYMWSELAEAYSDSALSAEAGLQYQLTRRFRVGVAAPLVQSTLQYGNEEEDLPQTYRAGIGWNGQLPLATGNLPLRFLLDVPYDAEAQEARLAIGAETEIGVLALRVGLSNQSDVQKFAMGAGFRFMRMNLDYSFGLVDDSAFDSIHKVTVSLRFGTPEVINPSGASQKAVYQIEKGAFQLYTLRPGETLESVAASRFGSAAHWQEIYAVNKHMYSSPDQIKSGSQILLPVEKVQ